MLLQSHGVKSSLQGMLMAISIHYRAGIIIIIEAKVTLLMLLHTFTRCVYLQFLIQAG